MQFDPFGFLAAVATDWVAGMSGILSIMLTAVGYNRSNESNKGWFWTIALIAFIFTCTRVWTIEHEALQRHLLLSTPALKLDVSKAAIIGDKSDPRFVFVYALGGVYNAGAPSVARRWKMAVFNENGVRTEIPLVFMCCNSEIPAISEEDRQLMKPEYFLPNSNELPIPQGGQKVGFVSGRIESSKLTNPKPGWKLSVEFIDVNDKPTVSSVMFDGPTSR